MRKQSKADKLADLRIDKCYRKTCSGIQVNMLDIPKIFRFGRIKIMEGEDDAALCSSIRAYVESIRVDK